MITKQELATAFIEHNKAIFNYIYYRIGQQKELAEDLAEEIFMKVWEKRNLFEKDKAKLKVWIYSITKHHLIDFYRKNAHSVEVSLEHQLTEPGAENTELTQDLYLIDVKAAMKNLSSEEQELITLRYINDYSIEEVADVFNTNYQNAKVKINRSVQKLKLLIQGKNGK